MKRGRITAVENLTRPISEADYRFLDRSRRFGALQGEGIASLVRSRETPYGIKGGFFVGQAVLESGVRLVVAEKVDGALEDLLLWTLPDDLRSVEAVAPVEPGEGSRALDHYSRRLAHHTGEYLRTGRLKRYVDESLATLIPRGKLRVGATARLRARGRITKVAVTRRSLTADLLPNQLIGYARLSAETMLQEAGDLSVVKRLRLYAPAFEDVDWQSVEGWGWQRRREAFDRCLTDPAVTGELRFALEYARALVLHLGQWPRSDDWVNGPPSSLFINLSTLFQNAAFSALRNGVREGVFVAKGASAGVSLFEGRDDFIANPDFTIGEGARISLAGDLKYKTDGVSADGTVGASHPDVFQLSAHCDALGALTGLLVYPGDKYRFSTIGVTRAGRRIFAATARPSALAEDMVAAVTDAGVMVR